MEKQKHPIDDYFREGLNEFRQEPSAAGREAFLKEAEHEIRNADRRKWWLIIPLLFLILAGIGTGTWLFISSPGSENNPSVTQSPPIATVAVPESAVTPDKKTNTGITSEGKQISQEKQPIITSETITTKTTETAVSRSTSLSEEKKQQTVISEPMPAATPDANTAFIADTGKPAPAIGLAIPAPDTLPGSDTLSGIKKKKTSLQKKGMSLNIGVNYIPEWMFNTLEGDKFVNNFGLEGTFRVDRYSIRTGVGLSITKGTNEVAIGYNDYLGSYQALDSITFTWDDKHYKLLPSYYLSNQDVWDSIVTQQQEYVIKRYTYLQIPLVLGYDFLQKGRFSMGVRTGPVLSLLLTSKQLSANYDPGKDKIVAINEVTPDRIQTNWQFMAGLNFTVMLNRRWTFELEPEAKYYFNSVYEKSDITKKPWSVGIRAAILFDLKK